MLPLVVLLGGCPVDDEKTSLGAAGERGRCALMPARTYLRDPARAATSPPPSFLSPAALRSPFSGGGLGEGGRGGSVAVWRTTSRREPLSETPTTAVPEPRIFFVSLGRERTLAHTPQNKTTTAEDEVSTIRRVSQKTIRRRRLELSPSPGLRAGAAHSSLDV